MRRVPAGAREAWERRLALNAGKWPRLAPNFTLFDNGQVRLEGYGYDPDEGPLLNEKLVRKSDRDGVVGTGQSVVTTPLTPGIHRLTLTGTDQDGNNVSAEALVTVQPR